ncbi:MAG TPA: methylglyoxal synthase [Clostridiaceae bacterium]|nr:methylglyoxal synthase [Clostridiaceae bacterium]
MNIALLAHERKKELLVNFCIAYKTILQNHNLFATGNVGQAIMEATGLHINLVAAGTIDGEQQIAARVAYNEMDLVIWFRDALAIHDNDTREGSLIRLCDIHSIPYATNIATAELLIKGVERGDLAWREIIEK